MMASDVGVAVQWFKVAALAWVGAARICRKDPPMPLDLPELTRRLTPWRPHCRPESP